jgi:hypothetical protein
MKFFQKIGVDKYKIMGSDANFKETKQLQKYVHNLFYTVIAAHSCGTNIPGFFGSILPQFRIEGGLTPHFIESFHREMN